MKAFTNMLKQGYVSERKEAWKDRLQIHLHWSHSGRRQEFPLDADYGIAHSRRQKKKRQKKAITAFLWGLFNNLFLLYLAAGGQVLEEIRQHSYTCHKPFTF